MYHHFDASPFGVPKLEQVNGSFVFAEYPEQTHIPAELYPADIKQAIKTLPLGKNGYVVIGGASLVMRGIKQNTEDIDMLVSPETYVSLLKLPNALEVLPPYDAVRNGATNMTIHIELKRNQVVTAYTFLSGNGYYPMTFSGINETAEVIDDVRVAALAEVVASKQALAREKDILDLGKIATKTGEAIHVPPMRDRLTETY